MTPVEVVREFISRICRSDIDGACDLVTDDVEYDNVPMGKVFGPQGIKDLLVPMLSGNGADMADWVIHREAATEGIVMNERTDRFKVQDRWVELPVCGVFEVTSTGKIRLWRDYFDLPTVTAAFGGTPDLDTDSRPRPVTPP